MTQKDLVKVVLNQLQLQIDNISSFNIVYAEGEKTSIAINYKLKKPWETKDPQEDNDDE